LITAQKKNITIEATIAEIHNAMKRGELTCLELVNYYLKRIERYDQSGPSLNAIIMVNPNVQKEAKALDEAFELKGLTGSLHGIPVLLKDNINTSDMPTTAGSKTLENVTPKDNGWVVKRLKDAGALIIAKANLHEFAVWGETVSSILGQTLNPYDLTRTPGGSSGGTGAGIAANFGVIGIGTDTINSVRSPASACSLIGFRPTLGLISRSGIVPYSLTQDTAGPITRTVEDAVRALEALVGYDQEDPITSESLLHLPETYRNFLNSEGLKNKRIGIVRSFFGNSEPHSEVNRIMEKSQEVLKAAGATLIDLEVDLDTNKLVTEVSVHLFDLKHDLGKHLLELGDLTRYHSLEAIIDSKLYDKGIEANLKEAALLDVKSDAYQERLEKRQRLQTFVTNIMDENQLDALVYPHQKRLVVPIGTSQVDRNGVLGAVTGFPAITVPAGFSTPTDDAPIGVPVGIEFLGRPWSEPTLIEIAFGFEQTTHSRRAPLSTP
jgi:Asp-tRNA(Asn)/Glu-tRNA(Gln) amidotransferase A subunit family amidase